MNKKNWCPRTLAIPGLAAGLDRIYKKVNAEGFAEDDDNDLEEDIQSVRERFSIGERAAVLLAAILENNARNGCDDDDLSNYIGCSNIEFLGFREPLREMEDLGIIQHRNGRGNRYVMSREALRSIEKDTDFQPMKHTGLSAEEVFTRIRIRITDYLRDIIDADRLLDDLTQLTEDNLQLDFCRKTKAALADERFTDTEKRFFYALCYRYVSYGEQVFPIDKLLALTDYIEDEQRLRRAIGNGRTNLQRLGLVTFGGDEGFQDTEKLALADDIKQSFFTEVALAKPQAVKHRDLIPAEAIKPRELFYDGKVAEQMERLGALLEPANFAGVQQRLEETGMPKGFAVLFAGTAGCGKTAGAYELARRTGRAVFAVDMSQLKSKWVGDSEKIVKGVFTTYREMCRTHELAPILLFNEADAIFSKRLENPEGSVDQMQNSLQNICLEAIENLDGILIATTNLATNFCDDAFARRFLFKMEFVKPEAETRAKIWKSMLDGLSDKDALTLASRYDFSGGNIENIARKATVGYVLSGQKATLQDLLTYCDEETLSAQKSSHRIGFNV
jgi:hypothetical protein